MSSIAPRHATTTAAAAFALHATHPPSVLLAISPDAFAETPRLPSPGHAIVLLATGPHFWATIWKLQAGQGRYVGRGCNATPPTPQAVNPIDEVRYNFTDG
uniref:Uncharacterized protein n=1 Tax=Oryza rufipogon TaxID=4529 RepID=A0A0E0R5V1_ORYRU